MSKKPSPGSTKSPGTHRERELRAKVNDLEEENRLLRHRLHQANPLDTVDVRAAALVDRFTKVILELQAIGDPRRSSPLEAQVRYKRSDSTGDEGAATRWARDLENRIHKKIKPLLDEYDARIEDRYQPPERIPQVRCTWDKCENYGKRIPQFVGPRGAPIELTHCPRCDRKLNPS